MPPAAVAENTMVSLTATLIRVVFSAPSRRDAGAVFVVLALEGKGGATLKASGEVDADVLGPDAEGRAFRVHGRWAEHPKYGRQVEIAALVPEAPRTAEGLAKHLARFEGVGPATARRVVGVLGAGCLDTLTADPGAVDRIPGLTQAQRRALLNAAAKWRRAGRTERDAAWLVEHGVGPALAMRAAKRFKGRAQVLLATDPWRLAQVDGCGFPTADEFAQALGVAPEAPTRIRAAVLHGLSEAAGEGHACLPAQALTMRVLRLLKKIGPADAVPQGKDVAAAVDFLAAGGKVLVDRGASPRNPMGLVYLPGLLVAEISVAEWFKAKSKGGEIHGEAAEG